MGRAAVAPDNGYGRVTMGSWVGGLSNTETLTLPTVVATELTAGGAAELVGVEPDEVDPLGEFGGRDWLLLNACMCIWSPVVLGGAGGRAMGVVGAEGTVIAVGGAMCGE